MLEGKFCAPCQKKGHLCPAATVQDGIGLCAFCQDEEECPVSQREKEVALRFGKAAVTPPGRPVLALAKEKVLRGTKEVKEEMTMEKTCKCGCGAPVSDLREYKWGHTPKKAAAAKDGAVPPRKPVSKPAKNWDEFRSRKNGERNGSAAKPPKNIKGIATLYVPETALDRFWTGRSVIEKAQIFTEWLTNGN